MRRSRFIAARGQKRKAACAAFPESVPGRSMPHARVVFGTMDAAAVAIIGALDPAGLAQGVAARLHAVDVRLVAFLPRKFAIAQRAVGDTVVQALFLVDVALHV